MTVDFVSRQRRPSLIWTFAAGYVKKACFLFYLLFFYFFFFLQGAACIFPRNENNHLAECISSIIVCTKYQEVFTM